MSSGEDKEREKKREREARNNIAAKQSRERKKMLNVHLTAKKAELLEGNAILRAQIECQRRIQNQGGGSSGAGPSSAQRHGAAGRSTGGSGGSSSSAGLARGGDEMLPLSNNMSKLFGGRREISGQAAVDILDRALTGSQGKGTPVDPELCRLWDTAQARAPVVPRPQFYNSPAEAAKHAMEIAENKRKAKERKERQEAEKRARKAAAEAKKAASSKRH